MKITLLNLKDDWAHVTRDIGITPPTYPRLHWSWWGVVAGWGTLSMTIERDLQKAHCNLKESPKGMTKSAEQMLAGVRKVFCRSSETQPGMLGRK